MMTIPRRHRLALRLGVVALSLWTATLGGCGEDDVSAASPQRPVARIAAAPAAPAVPAAPAAPAGAPADIRSEAAGEAPGAVLDGARRLTARQVLELPAYTADPDVSEAVRRLHAGDNEGAADLLEARLARPLDESLRPPLTYLLGVMNHYADRHTAAAALLKDLPARYPLLADYARYFAAASLAETGQTAVALALLDEVSDEADPRVFELRARLALDAAAPGASTAVARYLDRSGHAPAELYVGLAELRLAAGDVPGAVDTLWALWTREPSSSESASVPERVAEIAAERPRKERKALTEPGVDRRLKRAQALYDAHRSRTVVKELGPVVKETRRGSAQWCRAHYLIAKSYDKLRDREPAVPHYDALLKHCREDDVRVHVLYFGGKSAHQKGDADRALRFFALLHKEHPTHSYNDDALLREADIHQDAGRPERAREALHRALLDYPDGDMREDAAWRLQWGAYQAGRHEEALTQADENLALIPRERSYRSTGRTLYWKARSLAALGRGAEAEATYRRCLATYPLSWYAALAYARLAAADPGKAATVLADIVAKDEAPPGPLNAATPLPVTTAPAFRRGVELLRLGFPFPARRELARAQRAHRDAATDWLLTELYARADDPVRSHDIPRRRQPDFAEHYPKGDHEHYWRLAYPRPYGSIVKAAGEAAEVPPALAYAVMREESGFDAAIESWANAVGLMQLLVPTARDMRRSGEPPVDRAALTDPALNVRLGTRFLGRLLGRFGGHPALAVGAYNAGGGRMSQWLAARGSQPLDEFVENIPYSQTRGYTKRVIESFVRYRFLYGPAPGTIPLLPLTLPERD